MLEVEARQLLSAWSPSLREILRSYYAFLMVCLISLRFRASFTVSTIHGNGFVGKEVLAFDDLELLEILNWGCITRNMLDTKTFWSQVPKSSAYVLSRFSWSHLFKTLSRRGDEV
jgi:hypothetical protein